MATILGVARVHKHGTFLALALCACSSAERDQGAAASSSPSFDGATSSGGTADSTGTVGSGGIAGSGASSGALRGGGSPANAGGSGAVGASSAADGSTTPSGGTNSDAGPLGSPDGSVDAGAPVAIGDWGPGDYPADITAQTYLEISGVAGQGSYVRQYKVHVPPSYDPTVPTPVVFCIHGLGQNAVLFCVNGAAMDQKSDQAGFILVMPNGYQSSWNGGTCCGAASTEQLDDVALFRAIFEEVKTHLNVDVRRVYATGLSNGAYMSYRLACEASDIFAAVAPGAGAIGINTIGGGTNPASDFTMCTPSEHVSVLDIHGTADPLVPYSLQAPSLALISEEDGCGTTTVAATSPASAGDTTCVSYSGCPAGIEVIGCSISGGGHCWFGSPDCGTGAGALGSAIVGANSNTMVNTDAVWDFLSRFSK